MLTPAQIAESYINVGIKKTSLPTLKMFVLGIFAGMFVALAGAGSSIASATVPDPSTARLFNSLIFPAGLAMVILAGSELFTGNCLIVISVLEKKVRIAAMLRNWIIVYLGNMVGSLFIAAVMVYSHVPGMFGGALAESMVATAATKVGLSFGDAFLRGILCNVLVCISVWVATAASNAHGKIITLYLPIVVFVLCGFEHCVANMYSIPAGLFAASEYGIAAEGLSWFGFFVNNLIPVTLGNIVGGSFIVGLGYWYIYLQGRRA